MATYNFFDAENIFEGADNVFSDESMEMKKWIDYQTSVGRLQYLPDIDASDRAVNDEHVQEQTEKMFDALKVMKEDKLIEAVRIALRKGGDPTRAVSTEMQFSPAAGLTFKTPMDLAMRLMHVDVIILFRGHEYYPSADAYVHLLNALGVVLDKVLLRDNRIPNDTYFAGLVRSVVTILQVSRNAGSCFSASRSEADVVVGEHLERDKLSKEFVEAARYGVKRSAGGKNRHRGVLDCVEDGLSVHVKYMGDTPLLAASHDISNYEVVKALIDAGSDVLVTDVSNCLPMENGIQALASFVADAAASFRRARFDPSKANHMRTKEAWKDAAKAKMKTAHLLVEKTIEATSRDETSVTVAPAKEMLDDALCAEVGNNQWKRQRV